MGSGRKSKKAKTNEPEPLGFDSDSITKSQKHKEELDLEEAVFGKRTGGSRTLWDDQEDEFTGIHSEEEQDEQETGMERLRDENLFFFDAPSPSASTSNALVLTHPPSTHSDSDSSESEEEPTTTRVVSKSTNRRKPVWYDPADEDLTVSLKDTARLRKLRVGPGEDVVGGIEYESRLRRQFEKMHPVPTWAVEARRKINKKRAREARGSGALGIGYGEEYSEDSSGEDDVDDLFRTVRDRKKKAKRGVLEKGEIDVDRLRDANQAESSSSTVVSIGFHPRAQVLFSATSDRRLRLFQIDGTTNAHLQTIHVPDLPITNAAFHPSGSSILMTGSRPFFMSYDLQSGTVLRSPRGLLSAGLGGSDKLGTGGTGGMERFKFSQEGDMLAVGGRRGYVHLVDWGSSGVSSGGQVVGEVKMNGQVKGIAWQKDGRELLTLGEDNEVYVWDVGTRKCITRWRDEGGFGACGIENDKHGKYTAVASSTGILNIYDSTTPLPSSGHERKALKAIGNLTTSITSLSFSHDSQILALASRTNKDQLRLVHLPSATVFSNWPTQTTPLHHVTAVDFSKGSEYLAVGNKRGKVLLYNLKHYA